jgi:hypothetical protein
VSGSSQGSANGDLIDTTKLMIPANQLYLAVAPWSVTNNPGSSASNSSAIADLLVLTLGDAQANPSQSVTVKVLQSTSNANWASGQSTSNATADGAYVNAGGTSGLTLDLLHSDTSSSAPGSSYLISINGNQIGSNSQAGGQCALTIPSLLELSCLTATGGVGSTLASVLNVTIPPGQNPSCVSCSNSQSSNGPSVSSGGGGQIANPVPPAPAPAKAHAAVKAAHRALPFTGIDLPVLLGIAVLLLTGGVGLVWLVRRPRAVGLF